MYVIHNAGAGTWLHEVEGGLEWVADIGSATQYATQEAAVAVCAANGICDCWVEAV